MKIQLDLTELLDEKPLLADKIRNGTNFVIRGGHAFCLPEEHKFDDPEGFADVCSFCGEERH